jgi:hypothetical protein
MLPSLAPLTEREKGFPSLSVAFEDVKKMSSASLRLPSRSLSTFTSIDARASSNFGASFEKYALTLNYMKET